MAIVDEAIDLIAVSQDDMQTIVAFTPVILAAIMWRDTASSDSFTKLRNAVAHGKRVLD